MQRNVSPLDHRYSDVIQNMSKVFNSERYYKTMWNVEVEYLLYFLKEIANIEVNEDIIRKNCKFDSSVYNEILEEESVTKHDVKAVINVLQRKTSGSVYVHFGLTSQDIVSLSMSILMQEAMEVIDRSVNYVEGILTNLHRETRGIWSLSKTHGQSAVPHLLKDDVYKWRYDVLKFRQRTNGYSVVKFSGAVGNNFAISRLFDIDPRRVAELMDSFVKKFGRFTISGEEATQTDRWESFCERFSDWNLAISRIISDIQQIWQMCSDGYFKLKVDEGYCGSSAMPHKVNPIKFENAEGCFCRCQKDFEFYINKLSKSRMHRDLSDSVVIRMIPETLSYLYLGFSSFANGLKSLEVNEEKIKDDLEENYQVFSEIVQLYLKLKGDEDAYEESKRVFRGSSMTLYDFKKALKTLGIEYDEIKKFIEL
uniref:Adenylosuccinate lyase n=1 Tax=Ackermannviridae sp. TaxID=2831612 RepID=A0A8S5VTS1_9CAUD|nr:MAG TPA: adenylosuccinate lyase [Ackermannviridae sp.]